jgi:hypothetical protein
MLAKPLHRVGHGVIAIIGFVLSPLSWWNDLVVNVPLAYAFSLPFSLLNDRLFLPAFILGYWLTNVLGLIMLHKGVQGTIKSEVSADYRKDILISLAYTAIIAIFVLAGWLPAPTDFLSGVS